VPHADILACTLDYHAKAVGWKPRVLTLPKADNKFYFAFVKRGNDALIRNE
jgi:hypothetical protein